jgi:hypothetical protein
VDLFCKLEAVDQRFGTEELPPALLQVYGLICRTRRGVDGV